MAEAQWMHLSICNCLYSYLNTRALSAITVLIFHRSMLRRNRYLMHRTFRAAVWHCEVAHDLGAVQIVVAFSFQFNFQYAYKFYF